MPATQSRQATEEAEPPSADEQTGGEQIPEEFSEAPSQVPTERQVGSFIDDLGTWMGVNGTQVVEKRWLKPEDFRYGTKARSVYSSKGGWQEKSDEREDVTDDVWGQYCDKWRELCKEHGLDSKYMSSLQARSDDIVRAGEWDADPSKAIRKAQEKWSRLPMPTAEAQTYAGQ